MFKTRPLKSINETGALMRSLVLKYYTDVSLYRAYSVEEFFNYVKNLPYIKDPQFEEFIHRPCLTMGEPRYRDCDDKMVLMGSFLKLKGIPFRFVAVSYMANKKPHHVLIDASLGGVHNIVDPTYEWNCLETCRPVTNFLPLTKWI